MAAYVGCNQAMAVMFFRLGDLDGIVMSGYGVNHLDIAPRYAGVIQGLANVAGTSTGFLAPTVVGILTQGNVS